MTGVKTGRGACHVHKTTGQVGGTRKRTCGSFRHFFSDVDPCLRGDRSRVSLRY